MQQSLIDKSRTFVAYAQVFSLYIMLSSLPFRIRAGEGLFPRLAMITAGVLYVLDFIVNSRWRELRWERDKWLYIIMIAYYLYIPLWHFFSTTTNYYLSFILGERAPFLACGLMGLFGFNKYVRLRHICYVFLSTAVLTSLYIIFRSTGFVFFAMLPTGQAHAFTDGRIAFMHSHMFYNIYLNITLIFSYYLLTVEHLDRNARIGVLLASGWVFYILCLSEGRIGLVTALLLMASFVVIYIHKRLGWKGSVPTIVIYCLFAVAVMMLNGRFGTERLEQQPRWMIWEAACKTVQESPILGQGCCDAKHSFMVDHALQEGTPLRNYLLGRPDGVKLKTNPYIFHMHNTYLESIAEFGILGLATLLFIFLFPLSMQPRKNRLYIAMVVGCFMLQCMFERFIMPMLYVMAIIFFTSLKEEESGKSE